jgi:hypothetical protein
MGPKSRAWGAQFVVRRLLNLAPEGSMSHRQFTLASLLALILASASAPAQAEHAARGGGQRRAAAPSFDASGLAAERTRLQAELRRVNAEIDALKRAGGVRDDYRLRARLADAEALARRLIEIEARLGIRADAAPTPGPAPFAAPTDSAADLEAKADILADQSRRLRSQADALTSRARALRSRQDLRRRAADLDRDPFAPMEGSKRRVASAALSAGSVSDTNRGTTPSSTNMPGVSPPGAATGGGTPTTAAPNLPPAAPAPVLSSLSLQFRDLLDTATLAEIRRLEGTGASGTLQALDRASTALRARADELDARARGMRATRKQP